MNQKVTLTGSLGIPVEVIIYDEKYIVYHKTLQNAVNMRGISYNFLTPAELATKNTVVAVCNMADPVTKRSVSGVGEASPKNLLSEIEKQYPVTMAVNRAFDRAAIQMLGFKETVYSVSEMSIWKTAPKKTVTQPETKTEKPEEKAVENTAPVETKEAVVNGRPDMPNDVEDILQIGYVKGKSYKAIKDSKDVTKLIKFLKDHPGVHYDDELREKQAAFIRTLE